MLQSNDSGVTRGEMREVTTSATAMMFPEHITLVLTLPTVHWADRCRPATVRLPVTKSKRTLNLSAGVLLTVPQEREEVKRRDDEREAELQANDQGESLAGYLWPTRASQHMYLANPICGLYT